MRDQQIHEGRQSNSGHQKTTSGAEFRQCVCGSSAAQCGRKTDQGAPGRRDKSDHSRSAIVSGSRRAAAENQPAINLSIVKLPTGGIFGRTADEFSDGTVSRRGYRHPPHAKVWEIGSHSRISCVASSSHKIQKRLSPSHRRGFDFAARGRERIERCQDAAFFVRYAGQAQTHFNSAEGSCQRQIIETSEMSDAEYFTG